MQRVVIISGASSGIGAATALALASSSRLLLVARRRAALEQLAAQITAAGGSAHAVVADLSLPEAPAELVAQALERFGAIDCLVNNAGVFETAAVDAIAAAHAERLWRLNVLAPMLLAAAALPALRRSRAGWIVNVSSVAATATFPGCAASAGSKAAHEAWSRDAREELRPDRVRVGVIAPGATATGVWGSAQAAERARMCAPEDVAAAIRFMLDSPDSASIDQVVITPPAGPL
jgi:NADP-dependent 3-hydroxy acid dehydrogenase YdfG